jgi:hypothetical protein
VAEALCPLALSSTRCCVPFEAARSGRESVPDDDGHSQYEKIHQERVICMRPLQRTQTKAEGGRCDSPTRVLEIKERVDQDEAGGRQCGFLHQQCRSMHQATHRLSAGAGARTSSMLCIVFLNGLQSIVSAMQKMASDAARNTWSNPFSSAMIAASAAAGLS